MGDSKNFLCFLKFPWERESNSSKFIGNLCTTPPKDVSATLPQTLPKTFRPPCHKHFHRVRAGVSLFSFQYPLLSFSRSLRLIPHLLVTSILPSIACFRRQSLRNMWPIHLTFPCFIVNRIFLSLTLCDTSSFPTRSVELIFSNFLQHNISNLSRYFWANFGNVQVSAPYWYDIFVNCNWVATRWQ